MDIRFTILGLWHLLLGLVPLFDLLALFDFPELPEDLAWEEEDP